jgi:hypothetical protein
LASLFSLPLFSRTCNFRLLLLLLSARTSALGSTRATATVPAAGRLNPSSGRAALPTPWRRISQARKTGEKRGKKGSSFWIAFFLSSLGPFL